MFGKVTKDRNIHKFNKTKNILGRAYTETRGLINSIDGGMNIDKDKFKCWFCDWSGSSIKRIIVRFGNFNQINEWNKLSGIVEITDYEKIFPSPIKNLN